MPWPPIKKYGATLLVGSISAALSCPVYPPRKESSSSGEERGLISRTAAGNRAYAIGWCLAKWKTTEQVSWMKSTWHDRKTEHFKALTQGCHASALDDHVISTGHNIKWDHFEIIATGKSDLQCKIKETLLISELKPSLNENVGSEKLFLY